MTKVLGVYCKRSHFNDPRVRYCTVCGIAMSQAHRQPALGDRPQLGVVVLDDGTMLSLACDQVLGCTPEADPAVVTGQASPVRLLDPLVSSVHARVVLDGWEVKLVDAGSEAGTFVRTPGQAAWTRLPPGAGVTLRPGTVAAVGRRQFCYHSGRNQ